MQPMPSVTRQAEVTRILDRISEGDGDATDQLMPLVYDELRDLARGIFARQAPDHTLQPTALVHEAYVRLVGQPGSQGARWSGRAHFYAVAAKAMRQILINHAARRGTAKRGGGRHRITLDEGLTPAGENPIDLIDLDEALHALERLDPRQASVVELRFFGGLTVEECAQTLDVSPRTIELDWRMAKLQLRRHLAGPEAT